MVSYSSYLFLYLNGISRYFIPEKDDFRQSMGEVLIINEQK